MRFLVTGPTLAAAAEADTALQAEALVLTRLGHGYRPWLADRIVCRPVGDGHSEEHYSHILAVTKAPPLRVTSKNRERVELTTKALVKRAARAR